jgi:RNA polymerase sigma factor (sigma-70 family)
MHTESNDYPLWQSFKEGDRTSFQTIYFSNFKNLSEYGMRIIGDKELVKDCIHDLFVKLWNNKSNLGNVNVIRSYLLVSLRATLFNKIQQNSRISISEFNGEHPFEMVFSVESDFITKETSSIQTQKLLDALNELTPRQKEVIYLRYFEEMEYEEIAAIMEITVKATYKLAARGLETLRQIMAISSASLLLVFALSK